MTVNRLEMAIALVTGGALISVALLMLAAPEVWYAIQPGVAAHGPMNPHFIRDIGCAYLVVGACLIAAVRPGEGSIALLSAAAGILCLHAGVHAAEGFAGSHPLTAADGVTVFLPALVAVWLRVRAMRRFQGVAA